MSVKSINLKIQNLERRKKQESSLENSLATGIAGGIFDQNSQRQLSDQTVPLTDRELGFLTEIIAKKLIRQEDLESVAEIYRVSADRLNKLQKEGVFDCLSRNEHDFLTELDGKDSFSWHNSKLSPGEIQNLCDRDFVEIFTENERKFFAHLEKSDFNSANKLGLTLIRNKYGIDTSRYERWIRSGQISIPDNKEQAWLKAFSQGASLEDLKNLQSSLNISDTWHLKDRLKISAEGTRSVKIGPKIRNNFFQVNHTTKVNWYQTTKKLPKKTTELCKKDLDLLLNRNQNELSFWQKARLSQVKHFRETPAALINLLTPKQKRLLASSDADLSATERSLKKQMGSLIPESYHDRLKNHLISNEEYFFLASLRLQPETNISNLARQYRIDPDRLKEEGYLDFLSGPEENFIRTLADGAEAGLEARSDFLDLKKRGFITAPTDTEKNFLKYLKNKKIDSWQELKKACDTFLIPMEQLERLRSKGFIDYLTEAELSYLQHAAPLPKEQRKFLAESRGIASPWRLDKKLSSHPDKKNVFKTVDYIDYQPKFRFAPLIKYQEGRNLLQYRQDQGLSVPPKLSIRDTDIYLRGLSENDDLTLKESERLAELRAGKIKPADLILPSNNELAFIDKISFRKYDHEAFEKIGRNDFNLSDNQIDKIFSVGYITEKEGKAIPIWREPKDLMNARIWLSLKERSAPWAKKLLDKLEISRPEKDLLSALRRQESPAPFKPKLCDYEVYFKTLRDEHYTPSESKRLSELRRNGIHPESPSFQAWIKEAPSSWRMKTARKKAYLNHYDKAFGINREALNFTNIFKQVTANQLNQIGVDNKEIERYAGGIQGKHQILEKRVLSTPKGPIEYYSITHTGPISGRAFLEQDIPKKDISSKPQQRKDLLFHDLRVVDSVLTVIDEKKKAGWNVKEIRNESSQFSNTKKGLQNDQRQGGPAFMDAVIIFEEAQVQGAGTGKSETIAVEYGNYDLERMRSKLTNSAFDHAYVFSKKEYTTRYKKYLHVPNVSFRAI